MPMTPAPETNVVKLKYMDSEPGDGPANGKSLMQGWEYEADEPLLDGPISRRVAVIDLHPETGAVMPGAHFVRPQGRTLGRYEVKDEADYEATDFMQVSVFSAVMRMMVLFEAPDVLGRKLRWAFDGEQLLVVPRAGKMPNAFYHRDSRSLQFFFVDDRSKPGKLVYACLAPDIVAHETTHAILDGIAPELYDATSPQSLAMHEAIADLGAVMLAVRTNRLLRKVLDKTDGDIRKASAFNEIAKQFGTAILGRPLRDLNNDASFLDPHGLKLNEPHDLSLILTGALYKLLIAEYEGARQEQFDKELAEEVARRDGTGRSPPTEKEKEKLRFSVAGKALFTATDKLKRIVFRALDYLPPSEISFADYGRAMVAADAYSNPDDPEPREFIKAEFKRRGMVDDASTLDPVDPSFDLPAELDLEQLKRSDWAAYQFAETWREKLLIPPNIPFEVRPRLDVIRKTWRTGGQPALTRALLFKVSWRTAQTFGYGELVREVSIMRGTTLAIDSETRKVCTLLSTSPSHPSQTDGSTARNDGMRVAFLTANLAEGALEPDSPNVQIQNGTLRVRAMGQMLHMMEH
jgi:hypothetical protein